MTSECSSEKRPFTLDEFKIILEESEQNIGYTTEQIESGDLIKKKSRADQNLMYGRVKVDALESIFNIMNLKEDDIFIDLGHGIGVVSIQASYTRGCEARGIEIMEERYVVSKALNLEVENRKRLMRERDLEYRDDKKVGAIKLKLGDFTERRHWNFITEANKIFVNNAQGIFAERCSKRCDDYVASLFARTKPGTVMVTCWPLMSLGRSVDEENEHRKHVGLSPNPSASFFQYKQHNIGALSTTWGGDLTPLNIWVYERTNSEGFLCSNPKCLGSSMVTSVLQDDNDLLNDTCVYQCNVKRKPPLRQNKGTQRQKKSKVASSKRSKRQKIKPVLNDIIASESSCIDDGMAKKCYDPQDDASSSSSLDSLHSSNAVSSDSVSSSSFCNLPSSSGSSSDLSDNAGLSSDDEFKIRRGNHAEDNNDEKLVIAKATLAHKETTKKCSRISSQSTLVKSGARKRNISVSQTSSSKSSDEDINLARPTTKHCAGTTAKKEGLHESESSSYYSSSDSGFSFGDEDESRQRSKEKRREKLKKDLNADSKSSMTSEMKMYPVPQTNYSSESIHRSGKNDNKCNIEQNCASIGEETMDQSEEKRGQVKILPIPAKSRPKIANIAESKRCESVDIKQKALGVLSTIAPAKGPAKNMRESESRQIEKNVPKEKQNHPDTTKQRAPVVYCLYSSEESDVESGSTNVQLCNQGASENKIHFKKNIEVVDLT